MTTLDDSIGLLRARLTSEDVQIEDVWAFITLAHQPLIGQEQQPLEQFVTPMDLVNFRWLHNWWAPVQEKPQTLPTPAIAQFCWFVNHTTGTPPITFDIALQQFYEKCLTHCHANDMDPTNPGETADERRKRRNRERMAQTRAHRRVPDKKLKGDETVSAEVRALEAEIEELKIEAKYVDEEVREQVRNYQQQMMDRSAFRKLKAQEFKARIDAIRENIHSLIAKQ